MRKSILYFFLLSITLLLFADCTRRQRTQNRNGSTPRSSTRTEQTSTRQHGTSGNKSVVKMHNENGVYHVPCKINGTEMEFIFDTGASNITMSLTEASFLFKQGKLKNEDFIGKQQYQIADGSIHEGAVVILHKVQIGSWELNDVQASIVDNIEAPLLLGQSALAKFGKISIDYNKSEIMFE